MPRKILSASAVPTLVQERLTIWGKCIRKQRITQNLQAGDLCSRMGISDATLRRLERGDPGAGIGIFLSALLVLGILDLTAPVPDEQLWAADTRRRVRHAAPADHDADF
jgi:transcriptional regulator with XRE-family HTH domain